MAVAAVRTARAAGLAEEVRLNSISLILTEKRRSQRLTGNIMPDTSEETERWQIQEG